MAQRISYAKPEVLSAEPTSQAGVVSTLWSRFKSWLFYYPHRIRYLEAEIERARDWAQDRTNEAEVLRIQLSRLEKLYCEQDTG